MHWLTKEFRAKHGGPVGRSGLKNARIALKSFCSWASEYVIENLSTTLRKPAVLEPEIAALAGDEVQALLKACYSTSPARYERARGVKWA
jgi:hypothetical protein